MAEDVFVPGDPALMVRDFGGDGPDLVLLHGFGGSALHWESFAPLLTDRFRVLAPDLRCHGHSGDGQWHWDRLFGDLERAIAHLGIENPAVVGHSLGGAVAAMWAQRRPECPGAVDIDGIRAVVTAEENYPGLAPGIASRLRAELSAAFEAQAAVMAQPITDAQYEAMREQQWQLGGEAAVEQFERNLFATNGTRSMRPSAAAATAFRAQMNAVDLFPVFTAAACPLLVCAASTHLAEAEPYAELMAAYRRGIERDLAAAARANRNLRIEWLPASHAMVQEQPDLLAALVSDFLDENGPGTTSTPDSSGTPPA